MIKLGRRESSNNEPRRLDGPEPTRQVKKYEGKREEIFFISNLSWFEIHQFVS